MAGLDATVVADRLVVTEKTTGRPKFVMVFQSLTVQDGRRPRVGVRREAQAADPSERLVSSAERSADDRPDATRRRPVRAAGRAVAGWPRASRRSRRRGPVDRRRRRPARRPPGVRRRGRPSARRRARRSCRPLSRPPARRRSTRCAIRTLLQVDRNLLDQGSDPPGRARAPAGRCPSTCGADEPDMNIQLVAGDARPSGSRPRRPGRRSRPSSARRLRDARGRRSTRRRASPSTSEATVAAGCAGGVATLEPLPALDAELERSSWPAGRARARRWRRRSARRRSPVRRSSPSAHGPGRHADARRPPRPRRRPPTPPPPRRPERRRRARTRCSNPGFEAGVGSGSPVGLSVSDRGRVGNRSGRPRTRHSGGVSARIDIAVPSNSRAWIALQQGGLTIEAGANYRVSLVGPVDDHATDPDPDRRRPAARLLGNGTDLFTIGPDWASLTFDMSLVPRQRQRRSSRSTSAERRDGLGRRRVDRPDPAGRPRSAASARERQPDRSPSLPGDLGRAARRARRPSAGSRRSRSARLVIAPVRRWSPGWAVAPLDRSARRRGRSAIVAIARLTVSDSPAADVVDLADPPALERPERCPRTASVMNVFERVCSPSPKTVIGRPSSIASMNRW